MKGAGFVACVACALLTASARAADATPSARTPPAAVVPARAQLYASPTSRDRAGRILAPVMIDGRGPYRFIVDTGAGHSTLSPALATLLGDRPAKALLTVNGITGSAQVPFAPIRLLRAGALRLSDQRLPIIGSPVMAGADGILGVAGLTHDCISVDFKWNRVRIFRCGWLQVPVDAQAVRAVRLEGGLIAVPARIGSVRLAAIIDTGSAHTLGNPALRAALHLPPPSAHSLAVIKVYGVTPTVAEGEVQPSPAIRLGPVSVSGGAIVYGDFHIFRVWGMNRRPAVIIGMDVLGTVERLGIDFEHPEIYLEGARVNGHGYAQEIY